MQPSLTRFAFSSSILLELTVKWPPQAQMFKHLCFRGWHKLRRFGALGKWSLASGSGCLGGAQALRPTACLLSSVCALAPQSKQPDTSATTSPSPQQTAPHPKPRILPRATPFQVCGRTHKKTETAPLLAAARFVACLGHSRWRPSWIRTNLDVSLRSGFSKATQLPQS